MSIRPALQVVARASAGSTDLTASAGTRSYESGYQRASAAAMPFEHRRFMQDSGLPLTRILGNSGAYYRGSRKLREHEDVKRAGTRLSQRAISLFLWPPKPDNPL